MALVIAQLKDEFPDDFHFVYRHFPLLSIHDKALLGTQASEAAGLQGMFWEMYDYLYINQSVWSPLSVGEFETWLVDTAASSVGLDQDQFKTDLTSENVVAYANETWEFGQQVGIPGTPFLVLNGAPYQGPVDSANIRTILELLALKDLQFTECPPMKIDPLKQYIATIQTENGEIILELFPDVAPLAVNSFVFLAENGWFDGVTFHRVIPGFVAQAGDPTGTGIGGPGYAFKNETTPELVFDRSGLLAMANSGPDTNGSQFFITYGPADNLNGGYTIFGEVIEGMDVAENLAPRNPSQGADLPPGDIIITITIEER
jgi:cyclophilin family peptidyl-prolyl cis-trans isomerase